MNKVYRTAKTRKEAVSNNDTFIYRKQITYQIRYRVLTRDVNHAMTFPRIL